MKFNSLKFSELNEIKNIKDCNNKENYNNSIAFATIPLTNNIYLNFIGQSTNNRFLNYKIIIPYDCLNSPIMKRLHDFNDQHIYYEYVSKNAIDFFKYAAKKYIKSGATFNIDNINGYISNNIDISDKFNLALIYKNNLLNFYGNIIIDNINDKQFIIEVQHDTEAYIEPLNKIHTKYTENNRHYHTNFNQNKINQKYYKKDIIINNSIIEFYGQNEYF